MQQRVGGVEHVGGTVGSECAAETGRVGEDHGGSARGEAASGSQGQRKSQREQGHGNPGMMDGCSVISPEMKKWL